MKKKFKFNSAAIIIAGVFSLLAILGTVFSIRSIVSKADTLPPANDSVASLPSFYGYDIQFSYYHSDTGEGYTASLSYPFSYANGVGTSIYQFNDVVPVYMSITTDSTVYTRFDLRNGHADGENNYFYVSGSYNLGDTYLNELLYEHLFGGVSLSLGGATDYIFEAFTGKIILDLVSSNTETGLGESYEVSLQAVSQGNNRFLELNMPSWSQFVQENGYNDFVCVRDAQFEFVIPAPYFVGYISLTLNHISTPFSLADFETLQEQGAKAFAPLQYRPVDDIGLGSITEAVSAFFNIEFIPGFKIWYFLLIGLGVTIIGIGLKFFLGG